MDDLQQRYDEAQRRVAYWSARLHCYPDAAELTRKFEAERVTLAGQLWHTSAQIAQ